MIRHTPNSDIKWHNQKCPSMFYFNIWMRGLESFIKFDNKSGKLFKALGKWLSKMSEITTLILQFVLDMWYARNKIEHNNEGNKTEIKKNKIVQKIIWLKKTLEQEEIKHPYGKVDEEKNYQ
jgi:hypothetical protein